MIRIGNAARLKNLFHMITWFLLISPFDIRGQDVSWQLWMDYVTDYPMKKAWLLENELRYQTLLSEGEKWRSIRTTPLIRKSLNKHIDLMLSVPLSYTTQREDHNTFETRIVPGARVNFTVGRRIETRLTCKWERRYLFNLSDDELEKSNRSRIRAEFIVPIDSQPSHIHGTWYILADAEVFLTVDQNVSERFSNRFRYRAGVGYRLTSFLRFEAIYAYQLSRNELDAPYTTRDNIIRIRVKHSLRRTP